MASSLSQQERATLRTYRMQSWISTKHFKKKKDLYYATLEVFAAQTLRRDGEADPLALKKLMALVLESDRSFRGQVEKRNSGAVRLEKPEGWREICEATAGAVVDKYLREGPEFETEVSLALTREELRQRLSELADYAVLQAKAADAIVADDRGEVQYDPPASARPNMRAATLAQLEVLLVKEMFVFEPANPEEEIGVPKGERDREVAKRALAKLRLKELREIAEGEGLAADGSLEQLADRIAAKHGDDETEIAELVLSYEEDVPEKGFVTRLMPLRDAVDVAQAGARLAAAENTYVRVGVARWFIIRESSATPSRVLLRGDLRYYTVFPKLEYDTFSLSSKPSQSELEVRFSEGEHWIEIESSGSGDTRVLGLALERAAGVRPRQVLPLPASPPSGPMYSWHPRSNFMVAFLASELSGPDISILNLNVAQFESEGTAEEDRRRPAVRSVRLGGQHLMSSQTACELIQDGRSFMSLQATTRFRLSSTEEFLSPVRLELHEGFASVSTGFSSSATASQTRKAHALLLKRLRGSLENDQVLTNQPAMSLANAIAKRANEQNPEEADILVPAGDGDGGGSQAGGDGSS